MPCACGKVQVPISVPPNSLEINGQRSLLFSSDSNSLSTGAIIGSVIGSCLGLACLVIFVYYCYHRRLRIAPTHSVLKHTSHNTKHVFSVNTANTKK